MANDQLDPKTPITLQQRRPRTGTPRWVKVVGSVIAGAVVLWIGFLIFWILYKGSDIGTPSTAPAALIATNERLLQMAQWTIATILTLGGALIGLNWYQSERRYQDDRGAVDETLSEVQALVDGLQERFFMLATASVDALTQLSMQEIKQEAQKLYSPLSHPPIDPYIRVLRNENENAIRRVAAIRLVVEEGQYLKRHGKLTESAAQPFKMAYPDIATLHSGLAKELADTLIIPGAPLVSQAEQRGNAT